MVFNLNLNTINSNIKDNMHIYAKLSWIIKVLGSIRDVLVDRVMPEAQARLDEHSTHRYIHRLFSELRYITYYVSGEVGGLRNKQKLSVKAMSQNIPILKNETITCTSAYSRAKRLNDR